MTPNKALHRTASVLATSGRCFLVMFSFPLNVTPGGGR
jgi:hypothetical protein